MMREGHSGQATDWIKRAFGHWLKIRSVAVVYVFGFKFEIQQNNLRQIIKCHVIIFDQTFASFVDDRWFFYVEYFYSI